MVTRQTMELVDTETASDSTLEDAVVGKARSVDGHGAGLVGKHLVRQPRLDALRGSRCRNEQRSGRRGNEHEPAPHRVTFHAATPLAVLVERMGVALGHVSLHV